MKNLNIAPIEKPKRAFEVTIRIGADTWEGVEHELDLITTEVIEFKQRRESVSGGPSSNHSLKIEHTPDMTNEKYHKEIKRYLKYHGV